MITLALLLLMQPKQTTKPFYPTMGSGEARIDMLSATEYSRLQKLRQAVKDAELQIAKAHGVHTEASCGEGFEKASDLGQSWCAPIHMGQPIISTGIVSPSAPDTYQFRGPFLLINVPQEGQ